MKMLHQNFNTPILYTKDHRLNRGGGGIGFSLSSFLRMHLGGRGEKHTSPV